MADLKEEPITTPNDPERVGESKQARAIGARDFGQTVRQKDSVAITAHTDGQFGFEL